MSDERITTDVQSCYMVNCINNDALSCGLVRISITVEGTCSGFNPIDSAELTTE